MVKVAKSGVIKVKTSIKDKSKFMRINGKFFCKRYFEADRLANTGEFTRSAIASGRIRLFSIALTPVDMNTVNLVSNLREA